VVNDLTQQASSFQSNREKLYVLEKSDVPVYQTKWYGFWPMHSVGICSVEPSSVKSDGLVSKTKGAGISKS
jgi:hypothetical protein